MPRSILMSGDLARLDEFLFGLHACRRIERLPAYVVKQLPCLVGGHQTSWNHVMATLPKVETLVWPEIERHDEGEAVISEHIRAHPAHIYFANTGDPRAVKITDFMTLTQFHRTPLYNELYRRVHWGDHYSIQLLPRGPHGIAVVTARERPTFGERERILLNVVRPHIALAYRNTRALDRLRRRLDREQSLLPRQSCFAIDSQDRILTLPPRAERWLHEYFRERLPRSPGLPPDELVVLAHAARRSAAVAPLLRRSDNRELLVHVEGVRADGQVRLIMEERLTPNGARGAAALGLTRREIDVLLAVERGMTNDEVAVALHVSSSTVKRHLEHIFAKLNVRTRTAAVARLRGLGK